jgi:uncharacterized protein (DUF1786 family)
MRLHWSDKAISAAGQGFDVARTRSRVAQSLAQLIDGGVQAVVEIDEGIGGPELLAHLLARNHIAGTLEKQGQHLQRLILKAKLGAVFAQLARGEIKLEEAKAHDSARPIAWEHWHRKKHTTDDA